ncbi:hypothetical protein [Haloprofundus sp. MHR1]|uniref:hypothetical protein n=1 Tax=Haloprofundus sp. MHR1 TaxID=2572921 RepID=UPI0010BF310D|nr:hypothetical protein [Haloprofundus sp. MHR1]QCJ47246.1 hypothetical protein FCF25_09010 [Haloprofundus sp. MHR1]
MSSGPIGPITGDGLSSEVDSDSSIPSWLRNLGSDARSLLNNPQGFILVTVATWLVRNVVVEPFLWLLSMFDSGITSLETAYETAVDGVFGGFGPVSEALLGIPGLFLEPLESGLVELGLGAPVATTVATIVLAVAAWTVGVLTLRIIVDAIPGGGGLF